MNPQTLLVELLTEELPPKALLPLALAFADSLAAGLRSRQFLDEGTTVVHFATPRRLAALIGGVRERSPDRPHRERILPVSVALDGAGQASAALTKKLANLGLETLTPADLERVADGKGEAFFHTRTIAGVTLSQCLTELLPEVVARLPIPKIMSYQVNPGTDSEFTVQFVRPAHGLVVLHGSDVVAAGVLGLTAGRVTRGHRFMCRAPLTIVDASDYPRALHEDGRVVASFEERRYTINEELLRAAGEHQILAPAALLDEVTALVEWPVVYEGHFEEAYLTVPQECLILTMQKNQRYFALTDGAGRIVNRFLLVANVEVADPALIITGNERVLRARLADAKFFYDQDRKSTLASRLPLLESVVYHNRLGTEGARIRRVEAIAAGIARRLGSDEALVRRAAQLCKADLVTDMVGEFPELQGVMGRYYALHDGEDPELSLAIEEHYRPRFAGDQLPSGPIAVCVALADKGESLAGLFSIGSAPTGERDPYALRRAALGILRILGEGRVPLLLGDLLEEAFASLPESGTTTDACAALTEFLYERLRGLLRDQGFTHSQVESVISLAPQRIDLVVEQLKAVRAFLALPEADSLASANKRIANILRKASERPPTVDAALLVEDAERDLFRALSEVRPIAEAQFAAGDFTAMLASLAALRVPVDRFFNDVMVMVPDEHLRDNRLALLTALHSLMNRVADLSKLAA